jgi:hypothetical protein
MKKKLKANLGGQPECSDPVKEMTTTTKYTKFSNEELWAMARGDAPYVFGEADEDDEEPNETQPIMIPFMNLTKAERDKKSVGFKYGLCAHCDAGLADESEFVCEPRGLGCSWVMACNACHDYYQQLAYKRGCEGGCN